MRKINRKGNILTENIIFIILNLVFFAILALFLFSKTSDGANLEEKYAKQIALIIDSAEPGMVINLDMEDALKIAAKENIKPEDVVKINGNIVTVFLEKKGYSYSFFNDVKFDGVHSNYYLDGKGFVFVVDKNG